MQEPLYELLRDILDSLRAVTAELHKQHAAYSEEAPRNFCDEDSCRALSKAEAQAETLRRALGIASFS